MNTDNPLVRARRQRPGTAAYATGRSTAAKIIDVARNIVVTDGMAALSMRRIARELDMSPGNLSYYYATKSDLLEDLCSHMLQPYLQEFERLRQAESESPQAQLQLVLEYVFDDLSTAEATHFFPELWVLALRDEWAAQQMENIYHTYRSVLVEIIHEMHPHLTRSIAEDLALTISASIEGHTVFTGFKRQHADRAPFVRALIIEHLIHLVDTTAATHKYSKGGCLP